MIGKIERVKLRDVWKHEALDLTTWLRDNIDYLSDAISLNISNPEIEQAAGSFKVDIVGEDDSGNPVVIENQLEKSNHEHLGKLITYLVAIGAKTAIWIVSESRAEHIASISWLNQSFSEDFYLLKLEAIKIGDSAPAPLFNLIVGPSEEGKEVGKAKKERSDRQQSIEKFWTQLLVVAKSKSNLHANISPSNHSYIGTRYSKYLIFNYRVKKDEAMVELYIYCKEKEEENIKIFEQLENEKDSIEESFGDSLIWDSKEKHRACSIRKIILEGGYGSAESGWPEIHSSMVDAMIRLEKALKPHISKA
jgi:hypothetical protein